MDLSFAANVAQLFSVISAIIASAYGIWRRLEKRQSQFEITQIRISDKLDFVTAQFGPNGGGLRQAVNELTDKLSIMEERQINIGERLAKLDGEFDQHILETNKE
jgi:hypothetical protein